MASTDIHINYDDKGYEKVLEHMEKLKQANKKHEEQAEKLHYKKLAQDRESINSGEKLLEHFEELGKALVGAFAVEKIIEFGQESIKAFEDAEKAEKQLEFAIKNLAGESDKSFKELVESTEKLSKKLKTLYSPKELQEASTKLITVGKLNTEQVQKLLPRIADIAAKTGKSIIDVAESVSRATGEGQTRGLIEFGAKFKTTGNVVGDFNKILEKTAGFAGGAADSLDTLANKEKEAANQAEEMQVALGAKLAPVWVSIKSGATQAASALFDFFKAVATGSSKDLFAKYVTALTLNLVHINTEEEKAANYRKQLESKTID
jgi:hypothetical protein